MDVILIFWFELALENWAQWPKVGLGPRGGLGLEGFQ